MPLLLLLPGLGVLDASDMLVLSFTVHDCPGFVDCCLLCEAPLVVVVSEVFETLLPCEALLVVVVCAVCEAFLPFEALLVDVVDCILSGIALFGAL